jgi:hypothetical protein
MVHAVSFFLLIQEVAMEFWVHDLATAAIKAFPK